MKRCLSVLFFKASNFMFQIKESYLSVIMDDEVKRARLTQYLDFVKLYTEVHEESNKNAKKEANLIWKEKIQRESQEALSTADYLEQLALLKARKNAKALRDQFPSYHGKEVDMYLDLEMPIEFSCEGARKSVEIAGTFNNWTPQPLQYNKEEGDWLTIFNLAPGKAL